jgi:hypothetical protein
VKRVTKVKCKELKREYLGMYFYDSCGMAGNFSYAQATYKVTYTYTQGKKDYIYIATERGEPIYVDEHDIGFAHSIGLEAVGEILSYIKRKGIK